MSGYRAERLAHEIQRLLGEMLVSELRDPRLRQATITRVEVSHDLKHAKVYASTLDDADREAATQALDRARGFLRTALASQLSVRVMPELHFHVDMAISRGDRVLGIMRTLEDDGVPADDH